MAIQRGGAQCGTPCTVLSALLLAPIAGAATLQVPGVYPTIQEAIIAAQHGDIIQLNTGTYAESINFLGKAITITSWNPENQSAIDSTIIDGLPGQPTVTFQSGESRDALITGVTILGGSGKLEGPFNSGGGIFCKNASPTIRRCVIRNNTSDVGGGLFFSNAGALVDRCHIRANLSFHSGAGIKIVSNSTVEVRNCLITGNATTSQGGGGIDCFSCFNPSVPLIRNNTFAGNRALNKGSAVSTSDAQAVIINNAITSHRGGTAALFSEGAVPDVCDNITFNNSPANLSAGYPMCASGHLNANPQFVSAGQWNDVNGTPGNLLDDVWQDGAYQLTSGSAAIDSGDVTVAWDGPAADFAGLWRFIDDRCIANTGLGTGSPVDRGAHEFANPVVGTVSNFIAPGAGSWFTPANWSTGSVPTCTTSPLIDNRTVTIGAGNALADQIIVNNGAQLQIMAGASVTANDLFTSQTGSPTLVQQAGGTVRLNVLGISAPAPGSSTSDPLPNGLYQVLDGTLDVGEIRAGIGWTANGIIQQQGGTVRAGKLSLGLGNTFGTPSLGRYELTGGTLRTSQAELGKFAALGRGEVLVQNATWVNAGSFDIGTNECWGMVDIRTGGAVVAESGIRMGGGDLRGEIVMEGFNAMLVSPWMIAPTPGTFTQAQMQLSNGARAFTGPVQFGGNEQFCGACGVQKAHLFISGPGSEWNVDGHFQFAGMYPVTFLHPFDEVHICDLSNGGELDADTLRNLPYGHIVGDGGVLRSAAVNLGEIDPGVFTPGAPSIGTLTIEGSIAFSGIWNPGPPISEEPLEKAGSAVIHLTGTVPGISHDRLDINGPLVGGGKLDLELINDYLPAVGTQFVIVTYDSLVAPFALAESPTFPDDRFIIVSYVPDSPLAGAGGSIVGTVVSSSTLVSFDTPIPETLGGVPTDVVVTDLDGLNGPDLAVCMPGSAPNSAGSVTVLLNQGSSGGAWQGFGIVGPFGVGVGPISIAAGDFDGVNGIDLAVANQTAGTISLLLRAAGPGVTFNAAANIPGGSQPRAIAAADMNDDRDIDLVVSNPGAPSATVTVLQNNGNATFAPASIVQVGPVATAIDPADVDNDRDVDVVVLSTLTPPPPVPPQSQAGVLFNGDGSGSLEAPLFTLVNGIADSMTLADLNDDQFIDIVANNRSADTISYALNLSGQGYGGFVGLDLDGEPDAVTAGDFDGDGAQDVAAVLPGPSGDELKTFPNLVQSGQQVQFDPTQLPESLEGDSILIATADFNGDGAADVVTINDQSALSGFAGGAPAVTGVLLNEAALMLCPADIAPIGNPNGLVNVDDLLAIINAWGACVDPNNCPADIAPAGGNGAVNVDDLLAVISSWGICP